MICLVYRLLQWYLLPLELMYQPLSNKAVLSQDGTGPSQVEEFSTQSKLHKLCVDYRNKWTGISQQILDNF